MRRERYRQRKTNGFLFFLCVAFVVIFVAAIVLSVVLSRRIQSPEEGGLVVNQTSIFIPGGDGMVTAGDVIEFQTTFFNSGSQPIQNIVLNGSLATTVCSPGGIDNVVGDLDPGEGAVCTSFLPITLDHILAGQAPVQFFLQGFDYTFPSFAIIPVDTFGRLTLTVVEVVEMEDDGFLSVNDTITLLLTLTNTGTETIQNITLDGEMDLIPELLPGGFTTTETNLTVTVDDVNAGFLEVLLEASGTGITFQRLITTNRTFFTNVTLPPAPDMEISQNMMYSQGGSCQIPGDAIMLYTTVSNTGLVPLENIQVFDSNIGTSLTCEPMLVDNSIGTLLPGENRTCTGVYSVTTGDFTTGLFSTDITVTGTRFGSGTPFTVESLDNELQFAVPSDVRFVATNLLANALQVNAARYTVVRINTSPSSWASPSTYTVPQAGTYEVVATWDSIIPAVTAQLRLAGVVTNPTQRSTEYLRWVGPLGMGDTVGIWNPAPGNGFAARPDAVFCITKVG